MSCLLQWNFVLTNLHVYNEVLGITNDILQPGLLKCMKQNLEITNQFPYPPGTSLNQGSILCTSLLKLPPLCGIYVFKVAFVVVVVVVVGRRSAQ